MAPPPDGVHGVVPIVPLDVQLTVKDVLTGALAGTTRFSDAVPVKLISFVSWTLPEAVAQVTVNGTLLAAVEGATTVRVPDAGSEPWADQVEPPPPEGVQGFAPDVPVAFQVTLKLLLVGAEVGMVKVTPPATVQLVPVWLVTETLPVVGLMLTELPVVESWKLQVPSTVMVL